MRPGFVVTAVRNPISRIGVSLTTASALLFLFLLLADAVGYLQNPYTGLVVFVLVPALFVVGLLLIPIGAWLAARRRRAGRRPCVTCVDKANVLESSRLWRQVATQMVKEHPEVTLEHQLVDSAAMKLITSPAAFDVVVTENMFGDILTDEASVLAGSMGMLPSASLSEGQVGLYEPIHGSAPDIEGKGIANPVRTILSAALLLRFSLQLQEEARAIETAVDRAISDGARTVDLGGILTTHQMTDEIIDHL